MATGHIGRNVWWKVDAEHRVSFRVLSTTIRNGDGQRVERLSTFSNIGLWLRTDGGLI